VSVGSSSERVGSVEIGQLRAGTSGLSLSSRVEFESWVSLGRRLSSVEKASAWCLGDWLLYGQRVYGERYKTALSCTSFDYQTLRNYAWVARRFDLSRRRDTLSFQHHAEVASLPEAEQELWLHRAETLHWSRNELRRRVAAQRRGVLVGDPDRPVVVHLHTTAHSERRWRTAANAEAMDLNEWLICAADTVANAHESSASRKH
jgi:hypothetical protein